jgi:prepilin-type N-terminal cleavage/methylation domain-containing protein
VGERAVFMNKQKGFALIELLVVISVIVLLMVIVLAALSRKRGCGKREVCFNQLKQLYFAWNIYADEHQGRIPCADIGYSHSKDATLTDSAGPGWYEWPHQWNTSTNPSDGSKSPPHDYSAVITKPTEEDWKHAITCGSVYKYLQNYKVYRCPHGKRGEYVTYAVSSSMNTFCSAGVPFGAGSCEQEIRNRNQIKKPAERIVFVDIGYAKTGSYGVYYDREKFRDVPAKQHGNGQPASFADGHCEFRKWVDHRTIKYYPEDPTDQKCNQDLYWLQKVIWGNLGYTPSCTPEY